MIAPYVAEGEKWTDVLPIVLHAYNTAVHHSTGYTKFYLVHGYEPMSIFDIAIIPSNLNHSTIIEIQKLNSIREKLPDTLQKAFDKQKKLLGQREKRTRVLCGRKSFSKDLCEKRSIFG